MSAATSASGRLSLGGFASTEIRTFARIQGKKENATDGNRRGYLAFETDDDDTLIERMRITSTGNVGIGTTTVSAKLHSLATTEQLRLGYDASNYNTIAATGTNPNISINPGGTGSIFTTKADPSIVFDVTTATDTDFWLGVQDDAGSDDDDTFQIGDGSTPGTNPFLTINTSGSVGIGTTGPGSLLHVAGTGVLTLGNTGVTNGYINTTDSLYFNLDSNNNSTAERFVVATNRTADSGGTELFRIDENGNVGIGTTAPGKLVELYGASPVMKFRNSTNDTGTMGINFAHGSGPEKAAVLSKADGQAYGVTDLYFVTNANATNTNYDISTDTRMFIKSTGNVGIGFLLQEQLTQGCSMMSVTDRLLLLEEAQRSQVLIRMDS
ncbi:MAG: hypothetical protein UW22_C0030G0002 [Candidatus Gottesmanbacteria bacterium GW2011_GWB1_44_11c]|uniref:Uncharacterized protein n=1 Tax=Candidatus Gottesmanbacteria bacterium GW2011_GWB1_44_11c TaxID=1618447 RepID=A0A0G1JP58_9BACT|nr:MAG: hypothetical protein UW22_C0030G0002 [Candidatus Gottesmanbacteria bacterium GW2011_GWB1_44_11c]